MGSEPGRERLSADRMRALKWARSQAPNTPLEWRSEPGPNGHLKCGSEPGPERPSGIWGSEPGLERPSEMGADLLRRRKADRFREVGFGVGFRIEAQRVASAA